MRDPNIQVTGPTNSSWDEEMDQEGQGGLPGRGLHQADGQARARASLGRSVSPKRGREEGGAVGGHQEQFQPVQRRPRKVNYGKSKVIIEGAEAAPVEFFIGNTNPKATPDIITKVMKQCALDLPEKVDLEILEVKCLNNFDVDPNPRTKCWKLTVPYRFRELMARDDLYYCGWSHRQFYPPRQNKAKRHQPDPDEQHLHGAAGGQQPRMVGA